MLKPNNTALQDFAYKALQAATIFR